MNGIRGIRQSIPGGTVIGRVGTGVGAPDVIPLPALAKLIGQGAAAGTAFGQIGNNLVVANVSGASSTPVGVTVTALLDAAIGNTQGDILYRNASGWVVLAPGTAGQVLETGGAAANPAWATISAGTVTTVSVATANGFAGSVANPTTTPAITLSTTVTGLLKGNGTAISAAAAGTDYLAPAGSGAALTFPTGTFTPGRSGFTEVVGAGSITATGRSTIVGDLVFVDMKIVCAGGATIAAVAGTSALTGLPFAAGADAVGGWVDATTSLEGGPTQIDGTSMFMIQSWAGVANRTYNFSGIYKR